MKIDVIVPCAGSSLEMVRSNLNLLRAFLPMRKLVVITPTSAIGAVNGWCQPDVVALDENSILDCQNVRDCIRRRNSNAVGRAGWYIQQFLKMAYAFHGEAESYLVWDADTVPCRPFCCVAEDGKPVFDIRTEFHRPYFRTLAALFPGLTKTIEGSYVSEHMVIGSRLMRELIGEIGGRDAFAGRIIDAIASDDLGGSGFSEFETYGTWCVARHPGVYAVRPWRSLRTGARWFEARKFDVSSASWVGRDYDAISFEAWDSEGRGFVRRFLSECRWVRSLCGFEALNRRFG